ncbi:glycerol-3-phosphate 1-O-acyltransferase PlsY [Oscillospiraceae bacterium 52-8]|uniref:Glycerol-3-phosphate acyltransferase n=2 Tax=Bittarella massiliensis (ex Durand et al. 2017) TaxID=1720313 RepID=A0AAQ1MBE3_9FIRM|nr:MULTISPECIES: glycerol-3-phosphate 1-O-acyltransferase PlsY [Eubacteriales]ERJ00052.1 acyl-phosphate glycerol 3-phosphate acyltransferase [Clostridium sp. ATCC 29733]SHF69011.1 glycerol-3-phosphate acyltransferase PlsY [Bittarella massiliensis (ex Durand et al. 2017)]
MTATQILWMAGVALVSYLLGSVSWAVIVGKVFLKDDVRKYGSGNAGMTNVLRTAGKGAAALVAVGDFSKGAISVLLGRLVFQYALGLDPIYGAYLGGYFAVLGHIFPLYFHFKGGKGVLTSAGAAVLIDPISVALTAVVFAAVTFTSKIVSLGSIVMALCYPVITYFVSRALGRDPVTVTICAVIFAAIIVFMHRSNIGRLLRGEENRFGKKKEKVQK